MDHPPLEPPLTLRDPRVMTVAGSLPVRGLSRFESLAVPRVFEVGDGSSVLGLCHWQEEPSERPLAVVLHGLTGSAASGYAVGLAHKLFAAGFSVVRLNARNCGDTEPLARTIYHAALADDPLRVLHELARDPAPPRLYLAGFSMGGNLSLLMAASRGAELPAELAGVAAVSPPLDLAACSRRCEATTFNRFLTRRFLVDFERVFRRREHFHPGGIDLEQLDPRMSLWDFDATFTAPLAGFPSVEAYYAAGTVRGRLDAIRVPTLVVHALDDPLIPREPFLEDEFRQHASLRSLITPHGGHVAFLGRRPASGPRGRDPDRRWAENRVVDFLVEREQQA